MVGLINQRCKYQAKSSLFLYKKFTSTRTGVCENPVKRNETIIKTCDWSRWFFRRFFQKIIPVNTSFSSTHYKSSSVYFCPQEFFFISFFDQHQNNPLNKLNDEISHSRVIRMSTALGPDTCSVRNFCPHSRSKLNLTILTKKFPAV